MLNSLDRWKINDKPYFSKTCFQVTSPGERIFSSQKKSRLMLNLASLTYTHFTEHYTEIDMQKWCIKNENFMFIWKQKLNMFLPLCQLCVR